MSASDVEQVRRPLRRDARERRDRLIAAAQREFAARGVDASLEKIARDAGVAIGTLYRHFPTRLDLLMAAFEPRLQEFLDGATKALEIDDPWEGFVSYLENLFGVQAGDRGFNDFLSRRFPGNADTERIHDQMCRQIETCSPEPKKPARLAPTSPRPTSSTSSGPTAGSSTPPAPRRPRLAASPLPHARRLPGRAGASDPRAADDDEQLYDAMVHLSEAE